MDGHTKQSDAHPGQEPQSEGDTFIDQTADSRPLSGDEDSNINFMSDPSLSDGTGSARAGQQQRTPVTGPFRRIQSGSEDEGGSRSSPRPTQPTNWQPSPGPSSPGNTSLSSWESPAPQKVLLQFAAEPHHKRSDSHLSSSGRSKMASKTSKEGASLTQLPVLESFDGSRRHTTQPSDTLQPRASPPKVDDEPADDDFLQNLRIQSNGTFEESFNRLTPYDAHLQDEANEEDSNNETDASSSRARGSSYFNETNGQSSTGQRNLSQSSYLNAAGALRSQYDDTVNMTLSDSDGGDEELDDTGHYFRPDLQPLDWEIHNSANDEKTKPVRSRVRGKSSHGHRRTRSGDDAAATLATGGSDWKGMENDQIPLPGVDEDEDENDVDEEAGTGTSSSRYHRPPRYGWHDDIVQYSRDRGSQDDVRRPYSQGNSDWAANDSSYSSLPSVTDYNAHLSPAQQAFHTLAMQGRVLNQGSPSMSEPLYAPYLYSPSSSHSRKLETFTGSMEEIVDYSETDYSEHSEEDHEGDDERRPLGVRDNQMRFSTSNVRDPSQLDAVEHQFENRGFRGTSQQVLRQRPFVPSVTDSPFANLDKKSAEKAQRSTFLPYSIGDHDLKKYVTFICPRCKTRQREFFTVNDAPQHAQSPSGYLALYFAIYVIASLFIFGLEEGWMPLDCIYFAVITLTTAGLGDFVPTTNANKIICSIFIYFGVACIGLLLGSYIAGMLDDRAHLDRKAKMMDSCPNCARIQMMKAAAARQVANDPVGPHPNFEGGRHAVHMSDRSFDRTPPQVCEKVQSSHHHKRDSGSQESPSIRSHNSSASGRIDMTLTKPETHPSSPSTTPPAHVRSDPQISPLLKKSLLGSPLTRRILGRQNHTRHASLDVGKVFQNSMASAPFSATRTRRYSGDLQASSTPTIAENGSSAPDGGTANAESIEDDDGSDVDYDDDSTASSYSSTSTDLLDDTAVKLRNAKYVFLTLRQALLNSMVIIAVGCIGFWLIEEFSLVDSWYFTTVLLTTVGYGDIVPVTKGGKLFATIYILVAGTILLNNMSLISMIPLELRKRRIERVVLTQFGDQLDDAALRELATGPVIQRLHLSTIRPDGLAECTREMFSLAMLVRLGKVTEEDIRDAFAAFRRLDVNDEGVLNSKSIIAGMIKNRRLVMQNERLSGIQQVPPAMQAPVPHMPPNLAPPMAHPLTPSHDRPAEGYWFGQKGSLHVASPGHSYHFVGVDPRAVNERSSLLAHPIDANAGRYVQRADSFGSVTSRGSHRVSSHRESPF